MAETRHDIKIRADARAVKVAGQEIRKAFDPASPRQFRRELSGLQRRLKDITAAQVTLVKELKRVDEGTEAYKKLNDQLGAVADQAKTVKSAIGSITSSFKDFRAESRRGFGAGVAQGLGVAQYIPSEAGMGRRIGGAMVGRGIRRVGAAAMAPLRQPGLGGLTTMLGAIPIAGEMAAGQVQALAGMYQEAVAYQTARAENISYLQGGVIPRAMQVIHARGTPMPRGPGGGAAWDPRMKEAQERYAQAQRDVNAAEREQKLITQQRLDVSKMSKKERGVIRASNALAQIQGMTGGKVGAYGQAVGVGAPSITATRDRVTRLRVEQAKQGEEEARLDAIEESRAWDERRKDVQGRRRRIRDKKAFGPVELPGAAFGARFGFRAAETQAQLGQFMQARGGEYTALTRRQFEGTLAARRVYGIQAPTAGAFARMAEPGGGGMGSNVGLANMLQTSWQLGLRGSLIPEYLQTLVGLGQTAEKQGVKINVQEFRQQSMLLKGAGIQGPQIARITGGLQGAAMDLSQRGVSSPVDMMIMRAAGYDPSQGIEGYSTAMNKLAGGMDVGTMSNLIQMAGTGARGGVGGAGRQTTIMMMRRYFGRMKIPIGPGIATTLLDAQQQGKLSQEHLDMIKRNMEKGDRRGTHGRLVTGARIGVGMVAGLTQTEATMEAKRIALGTRMAGTMKALNEASLTAAGAVSNFKDQLTTVANWMVSITKTLEKATEGGASVIWASLLKSLGF